MIVMLQEGQEVKLLLLLFISNEHGNANDKINGLGLFFREFVGARKIYLANHRIVVYYQIPCKAPAFIMIMDQANLS